MKARAAREAQVLTDIPNIGPAMVSTFQLLNIKTPTDLKAQDPFALYIRLNKKTRTRYDPCVLDVFIAAVDFMNGAPPHPWWHYTKKRKKHYPEVGL